MNAKRPHERAVKKSVSLPLFLYYEGSDRQRAMRLPTFSDYLQELIRRDTGKRPEPAVPVA